MRPRTRLLSQRFRVRTTPPVSDRSAGATLDSFRAYDQGQVTEDCSPDGETSRSDSGTRSIYQELRAHFPRPGE